MNEADSELKSEKNLNSTLEDAAKEVLDEYREGGSLRDFDVCDDIMEEK